MATTSKKWQSKKPSPSKRVKPVSRVKKTSAVDQDAAERKKISKTLDVSAFMTYHKKNIASASHWEKND